MSFVLSVLLVLGCRKVFVVFVDTCCMSSVRFVVMGVLVVVGGLLVVGWFSGGDVSSVSSGVGSVGVRGEYVSGVDDGLVVSSSVMSGHVEGVGSSFRVDVVGDGGEWVVESSGGLVSGRGELGGSSVRFFGGEEVVVDRGDGVVVVSERPRPVFGEVVGVNALMESVLRGVEWESGVDVRGGERVTVLDSVGVRDESSLEGLGGSLSVVSVDSRVVIGSDGVIREFRVRVDRGVGETVVSSSEYRVVVSGVGETVVSEPVWVGE